MAQIATTIEQSKMLLELGINSDTADMSWHFTDSRIEFLKWKLETTRLATKENFGKIENLASPFYKHADGTPMSGEEVFDKIWGKDLPAWSLGSLIGLMPKFIDTYELFRIEIRHESIVYLNDNSLLHEEESEDIFANCINMIEWLMKNNIKINEK